MHEYPVTKRIIAVASEFAAKNGIDEVKQINLVVGDYSGYVASSIELYFDIIAEGTPCSGSKLNIMRVKPKLKCSICGELFERKLFSFECPVCGGDGVPTEIGQEFYIKSIEV
ncbi:hydrogenase maturation nickel metallochaperone HypA/HybF [Parasporobacterium paucivorans]|uniref:Hydrogenase nickel incorporation protein HypA/HybF n=1 Tax=Parasporobacterium paucivorans DSM 15970 TaxID=1122934 RepID=A0A1M6KYF2_9FIRM|nr:hydrogenase maturation nickel metallochaperone HypA [Parasporobacterium paucivorans]SHJ63904.1 hydrogenase nickel incorporation protein HypA/HybF [Parasporobacterium paucivorans DSM 15970]